jgi:DNA-3-methyladenine glycosylase
VDAPSIRELLSGSAVEAAPRLLGAHVRSLVDGTPITVRITEVEAYEGASDPASHAFRGQTPRTAVMFGPAAHLYCYFVYGMYWCANITCGVDGQAAAVLLRAGQIVNGAISRSSGAQPDELPNNLSDDPSAARGPAKLARSLGLTGSDTGADLLDPTGRVQLLSLGPSTAYLSGPRVGLSVAAEVAWRFWLPDEPSVSTYRPGGRKRAGRTGQTHAT